MSRLFHFEYHLVFFNSYLLTPWCRVLLEKLTGLQLVKKFPAFHGILRFITAHYKRPPPVSILGNTSGLFCLQRKHPAYEWFWTDFFYREVLLAPHPTPKLEDHPRRLSTTAYSIYSQLPSLSETVPLSATWGRAMSWWQGPTTRVLR